MECDSVVAEDSSAASMDSAEARDVAMEDVAMLEAMAADIVPMAESVAVQNLLS